MAPFNEQVCTERHERINTRFDKGDLRMDAHENTLNNHELRLSKTEDQNKFAGTMVARVLDRLLSILSGVVTALILAWLMSAK